MSPELPAVTIGIPFYNAEATLLDAVRSVFAQTHRNWELILLDDGSTDRSLELAKLIKDPRVRVYSDGQNRRLAARLNQITELAKYEFIARMDADDLMSPVRIERQLEVLVSRQEVDLVSTGVCSLTDDCEPVGIRCISPEHTISASDLLSGHSGIVHASIVGRRAWFERNLYKESMAKSQDTNLWVRAYSKDDLRVAFLPDPFYYYREDGNISIGRLLLAYKMGRHTILEDAKLNFSLNVRLRGLVVNLIKTVLVRMFGGLGLLVLIRSRRNSVQLVDPEKSSFISEIEFVRRAALPVDMACGRLAGGN